MCTMYDVNNYKKYLSMSLQVKNPNDDDVAKILVIYWIILIKHMPLLLKTDSFNPKKVKRG